MRRLLKTTTIVIITLIVLFTSGCDGRTVENTVGGYDGTQFYGKFADFYSHWFESEYDLPDIKSYIYAISADGSLWEYRLDEARGEVTRVQWIADDVIFVDYVYTSVYFLQADGGLYKVETNGLGDDIASQAIKLLDDVESFSVGGTRHDEVQILALKNDGSLWTWERVKLHADGYLIYYYDFGKPVKIMEDVAAMSAGVNHSLAIKADGSLWAWGENTYGQLGSGTTDSKALPLRFDAESVCDENDEYCGEEIPANFDNTLDISTLPIKVMDDVKTAVAGSSASAIIKNDGSLWICGCFTKTFNDLQNSDIYQTPVKIIDDATLATFYRRTQYVTGENAMFVIKSDGSLWHYNGEEPIVSGGVRYVVAHFDDALFLTDSGELRNLSNEIVLNDVAYFTYSFAVKNDGSLWQINTYADSDVSKSMNTMILSPGTVWVDSEREPAIPVYESSAPEPFLRPTEVILLIDGYRTTINAYETMWNIPYISLNGFKAALEDRNLTFETDHLPSDAHEYMNDTYVRAWDIIPYVNFEMGVTTGIKPSCEIITIYTEELNIGEQERQLIMDFLLESYPQIFRREALFEYYGEGMGSWYAGDYQLFGLGGDVLGVSIKLMDAGSTGSVTYLYAEGEFQRVGLINPYFMFYDDEGQIVVRGWDDAGVARFYILTFINGEWQTTRAPDGLELTPARTMGNLRDEIYDAANNELWQTAAHPSGAVVDIKIPDGTVDLVINYFECNIEDLLGEQPSCYQIDEIKWSQINSNLIRVKVTINNDKENWFWLELDEEGKNIENCIISWWW